MPVYDVINNDISHPPPGLTSFQLAGLNIIRLIISILGNLQLKQLSDYSDV